VFRRASAGVGELKTSEMTRRSRRGNGGAMTETTPDPLSSDEDFLTRSESLDENELGVDPLESGMDPPEGWSAAERYGTTAREEATDRPVAARLAEERPDVTGGPVPERPVAETPIEQLDDSIDDQQV